MTGIFRLPIVFGAICFAVIQAYQAYEFVSGGSPDAEQKKLKIKEIKKRSSDLDLEIKKKQAEASQLEDLKNEEFALRSKFDQLSKMRKETQNSPQVVKGLYTEAKLLGLKFESIQPSDNGDFSVTVQGAFRQVLRFCDRISQREQPIKIDGYRLVSVSQEGDRQSLLRGDLRVKLLPPLPVEKTP